MSESNEQAMAARLTAAGFQDINSREILVLAALQMSGHDIDLGRVPHELVDGLVKRGYLAGHNDAVLTSRARTAVTVAKDGVLAARWDSFPFRPGDIVISTPIKSGTTWMQMICALLIFQTPDLPAPLDDLSPWLDQPMAVRHEVFARYMDQRHRRFIKTHSPLADIAIVPHVTYIVVGRSPLDAAVSHYHQASNVSRGEDADFRHVDTPRDWLLNWIAAEPASPVEAASLSGVLRHISDAWERRDARNVVLMHYQELSADLEGQMRYLASRLGITVSEELWPGLVKAATFEQMRASADRIRPLGDMLKDKAAFFRKGGSGSGAELLTAEELASYRARVAQVAQPDLLAWLHRPG